MADNILQFSTRVDLSGAKAGLAELSATIQDQMGAATASVASASDTITASFDVQAQAAATASGKIADAFAAVQDASSESAGVSVDSAASITDAVSTQTDAVVSGADIQAAAYRQVAEAILALSVAQQNMPAGASLQKIAASGGQDNPAMVDLVATAYRDQAEAAEQLALAKKNLAEVTAYTNAQTKVEVESQAIDAAAKAENAVATNALANAESNEASALGRGLSARMAATAEIRTLEGNINGSSRAAAAFLTMIPGIGAALQKAFVVFGAVALLEVIYQIGDAYVQMYEKAHQAGNVITDAFDKQRDSINEQNASLDVENDKLQFQIDKLEGTPNNGLKTALDESIEAADKLQKMLQSDNDELDRLLKQHSVGALEGAMTDVASTAGIGKQLAKQSEAKDQEVAAATFAHNQVMQGIAAVSAAAKTKEQIQGVHNAEVVANEAYFGALAASQQRYIDKVKTLNQQQLEQQRENNALGHDLIRKALIPDIDFSPGVALTGGALAAAQSRLQTIQSEAQQSTLQARANADTAHKADEAEAARAAAARLTAIEEQFTRREQEEIRTLGHGPSAAEALAWWEPYLAEFDKQTKQYEHILEQVNKYAVGQHKQMFEGLLKTNPNAAVSAANTPEEHLQAVDAATRRFEQMAKSEEEAEKGVTAFNKAMQKQAEDLTHTGDRWDGYNSEVASGKEIEAANADALAAVNDQIALARGDLDQREVDIRAAARSTIEYTLKLQALREELARLQSASKTVPGPFGGQTNVDPANAAKIQQVQNEISKMTGAKAVTGAQDSAKITQDLAAPYLNAFNKIDTGWKKVQNDLIAGNKNIRQDFLQMGVHLVQDAAAATEKILADFIRHEILKVAAAHATAAATTATAATSTAAQNAIETESLTATLSKEAVKAAAKSYAWAASWGGPIAGAIAAAVAFTGVESLAALAAFEQGGVVSGSPGMPVPIVAHAGERVLSTPQTAMFERMVNQSQPSNSSRNVNVNYSPTIHAFDRVGFRSTLQAHAGDITDIVKAAWNQGKIK